MRLSTTDDVKAELELSGFMGFLEEEKLDRHAWVNYNIRIYRLASYKKDR